MRIAVTGASGLIGTPLVEHLRAARHEVLRLVRRPARGVDEVEWNPVAGTVTPGALDGVDAVIHLAGAGVGDKRWSPDYKREILQSRIDGTQTIARAIAQLEAKPAVLISASAIGFYGDTGDNEVDESSPAGSGFLADVVVQWEAAAEEARQAGIRVVHPRTGLVLTPAGGALGKLLPLFKAGVGGKLGSGKQLSLIHI